LAGIPGAAFGGAVESVAGTLIGLKLGSWADNLANAREADINRFAAELLANPKLIRLASAPPTDTNIDALMRLGQRLGYIATKSENSETKALEDTTTAQGDPELLALEAELKSLQSMIPKAEPTPEPKQAVKVGKQNISIPTGKEFAPPSLVRAVMKAESAGKQEAISPKGARGLMQLMPGTAKDLGVNPDDPQENVEGGSKLLRRLLNKYDSREIALAAYNWGPGNIDKAIRKVKAAGKEVTWANILSEVKVPQETRKYVPKVISNIVEA
jgi:soluble lytic murein transglycosylase-like protein